MPDEGYDYAVFGASPLAGLLAGLLAAEHGKSVCLVGEPWSPFRLPRGFSLSVMPITRPETWDLLGRTTPETLKLLGMLGKGLFERVDPIFVGERAATIDMLGHMRHCALGMGVAVEQINDRNLVPKGVGVRIRDGALLVEERLEPVFRGWLAQHQVRRFDVAATVTALKRDGTVQLEHQGRRIDAAHAILADDAAILGLLDGDIRDRLFRAEAMTSVATEAAKALPAPLTQYLDRGVALLQRGLKGPVTALASGASETALDRIGASLVPQGRLRRDGEALFRALATNDGAPLIGPARGVKATIIAGLGPVAPFLAPAIARQIAGTAGELEQAWFGRRDAMRGNGRPNSTDYPGPLAFGAAS